MTKIVIVINELYSMADEIGSIVDELINISGLIDYPQDRGEMDEIELMAWDVQRALQDLADTIHKHSIDIKSKED